MNHIWNLVFRGADEGSGTLMGCPLIALMTHRETGSFTPSSEPPLSDPPTGWVVGELVATTREGKRTLRARVIAREGGQWQWKGGHQTPGTRYCDFHAWSGNRVTVEADKAFEESWFGQQLRTHGWVDEDKERAEFVAADEAASRKAMETK